MSMKTAFRAAPSTEACQSIRRRLEKTTGVPWGFYYIGIGVRFVALADRGSATYNPSSAEKLLPYLGSRRRSFESIWKASDLSWREIADGAWTLYLNGRAEVEEISRGSIWKIGLPEGQ